MDVSKPGGTRADATARPIITGHEIMKDPMVTDNSADEATLEESSNAPTESKELTAPSVTHKVIAPLAKDTDDTPSEEKVEEPKKIEDTSPGDAVVDAVLEQVDDKKVEKWRVEEEQRRQEAVEKLVEEKKYFLPIDQVRSRRNNKLVLVIIAVFLPIIVGLGLAIDAGVIKPGFSVPFDFITEKSAVQTPIGSTQIPAPVPVTKKFNGKVFNFSIEYPGSWSLLDLSNKDISVLDVQLQPEDLLVYKLRSGIGNLGKCTPFRTDTPHNVKNACPTYEETAVTEITAGYLVTTKYTILDRTNTNYCFRPKTAKDGTKVVVSQANLSKPIMGPYKECREDDIAVTVTKNMVTQDIFKEPTFKELQKALGTITFTYPKS